jgi:hypothetical protein
MLAGSHTARNDTLSVCGRADTGFSLLFQLEHAPDKLLRLPLSSCHCVCRRCPVRRHAIPGGELRDEFLTGKVAQYNLLNFPEIGSITTMRWDEARQNFSVDLAAANQLSINGKYYGALESGAHNPACGPFPPGNVLPIKHGTFTVTVSGGALSLNAQYVDGSTCQMSGAPVSATSASANDGYLSATFSAAAACPEYPGGLEVQVNGGACWRMQRITARARA